MAKEPKKQLKTAKNGTQKEVQKDMFLVVAVFVIFEGCL